MKEFPELFADLFPHLMLAKACATCKDRRKAFGVPVCAEKHKAPPVGQDCPFWNRRGD